MTTTTTTTRSSKAACLRATWKRKSKCFSTGLRIWAWGNRRRFLLREDIVTSTYAYGSVGLAFPQADRLEAGRWWSENKFGDWCRNTAERCFRWEYWFHCGRWEIFFGMDRYLLHVLGTYKTLGISNALSTIGPEVIHEFLYLTHWRPPIMIPPEKCKDFARSSLSSRP